MPTKKELFDRTNGRCPWCGGRMHLSRATREHIIPKSLGGSNEIMNLVLAHPNCNKSRSSNMNKRAHPDFEFINERIRKYLLYGFGADMRTGSKRESA